VTAYAVTLVNGTNTVWTLVAFITIPNAAGMLSVAWQISPAVAPGGNDGVKWTDGACVCIGSSSTVDGVQIFRQNLAQPAASNQAWVITSNSGALTLTLTGPSITPGQIEITNSSGQVTNAALGYSTAAAVYSPNLLSGVAAGFIPGPRYWVLITQSAPKQGQVIANANMSLLRKPFTTTSNQVDGQFIPPIALAFPSTQTAATVTLSMDGSTIKPDVMYAPIG